MTKPSLTIHRSADEIGGNCIEIACDGERLILDVGRPLTAPRDATDLLPSTLDLNAPVSGVLISHPHQDHYGLLNEIPRHWAVYSGRATWKLMNLTSGIFGALPELDYRYWENGESFNIGSFRITPFLTDHSAFDAYMLLVEVAGKRMLYSGDFRIHGRKSTLVRRMMVAPPPDIDVLLMEGTNLGTNKPTASETDLESRFVALFNETAGRVFVSWSAQNIDRTVTIYRACKRSNRTLIVDLYTAEVLELLAEEGCIPQPNWQNIKVVITRTFRDLYKRKGREDFVTKMAKHGISAAQIANNNERPVIMIRPSLMRDFSKKGVMPDSNDAWCFSQWQGYLEYPEGEILRTWFEQGGTKSRHIHSSGHASVGDLHEFAKAINPKVLVPVHGVAWDTDSTGFDSVRRLPDGAVMAIE